mmetsp:Transcript_13660/g.35084  ORF Transcript_13660/g.35084 Transcript_13660/m.35084 type:complete len:227 (+) Transcript_13660:761-1441(+)
MMPYLPYCSVSAADRGTCCFSLWRLAFLSSLSRSSLRFLLFLLERSLRRLLDLDLRFEWLLFLRCRELLRPRPPSESLPDSLSDAEESPLLEPPDASEAGAPAPAAFFPASSRCCCVARSANSFLSEERSLAFTSRKRLISARARSTSQSQFSSASVRSAGPASGSSTFIIACAPASRSSLILRWWRSTMLSPRVSGAPGSPRVYIVGAASAAIAPAELPSIWASA